MLDNDNLKGGSYDPTQSLGAAYICLRAGFYEAPLISYCAESNTFALSDGTTVVLYHVHMMETGINMALKLAFSPVAPPSSISVLGKFIAYNYDTHVLVLSMGQPVTDGEAGADAVPSSHSLHVADSSAGGTLSTSSEPSSSPSQSSINDNDCVDVLVGPAGLLQLGPTQPRPRLAAGELLLPALGRARNEDRFYFGRYM